MKPKTLTLLILSAIVMASVACGPSEEEKEAQILSDRGYRLLQTNHNETAIEVLSQSVALSPHYRDLANIGIAYWRMAEQAHEQAYSDSDDRKLEQSLRYWQQCIRYHESALTRKDEDNISRERLAGIENNIRDCREAAEYMAETIERWKLQK